jgi:type VI secretion system secreted protein VgrG
MAGGAAALEKAAMGALTGQATSAVSRAVPAAAGVPALAQSLLKPPAIG